MKKPGTPLKWLAAMTLTLLSAAGAMTIESWDSCCGAVTMHITAEILGRPVDLACTRRTLRTHDGGLSSMADIHDALTELGFFAVGLEMDALQLERCTMPMIVYDPPKHFVVCIGLGKDNGVLWLDAPHRPRTLKAQEIPTKGMKALAVSLYPIKPIADNVSTESAAAQQREGHGNAQAAVHVDEAAWDLGSVSEGNKFSHKFVITNNSQTPFELTRATSTCACLAVKSFQPLQLAPAATTELEVELDTTGLAGRFRKLIYINTAGAAGDGMSPISLAVTADVETVPRLICDPYFLELGDIPAAEVVTRNVAVRRIGLGGVGTPIIDAHTESVQVISLEPSKDSQALLTLRIISPPTPGLFEYNVIVGSTLNAVKPYALKVRGRVLPMVVTHPERFFLGEIPAGAGIRQTVRLTHRRGEVFQIHNVRVSSPALEVLDCAGAAESADTAAPLRSTEALREGPLAADVVFTVGTPTGVEEVTLCVSGIVVDRRDRENRDVPSPGTAAGST